MWQIDMVWVLLLGLFAGSLHGQTPIEVPIMDFEGLEERLPEHPDQLVIVNFWATWCKPCVKEMPFFNSLSRKYADAPQIRVILVSLDMETQMKSRLLPFMAERELHPEVWLLDDPDANRWIDKVDPSWSGAIPATLFYKGNQRKFYQQSFHSLEELEDIIQTFL